MDQMYLIGDTKNKWEIMFQYTPTISFLTQILKAEKIYF